MTQQTLVVVVPPKERGGLRDRLAQGTFEYKSVPHAVFSVKGEGVVATLYASGKLVVQGEEPDVFCARWLGLAAPSDERGPSPAPASDPAAAPTVGSDETGKGDYFGPLIVCAVRLESARTRELLSSGVTDSKRLTDERALELGAALRTRYPYAIARLDPADYNQRHRKGKLNDLLADLHTQVIRELAQAGDHVVVDQFANERLLQQRLRDLDIDLHQRFRGEEVPAVAAASVIAREEFLLALRELSDEAGVDLHKGAGAPVDKAGAEVARLHGLEGLGNFAKLHFKNTERVRQRV